ncbi:hypothetical protein J3R82DRAFT_10452 [Butyriboletus roseoflavus]|nr:hypothetical protein J3R82DRAFT_10452 [Butyriboletus roseoflavus]
MAPTMAPDGNVHMFHPMNPMAAEYYVAPYPIYTSHLPQFSSYYATDDSRLVADTYGQFVPTHQPLDNSANFGGIFSEPLAAYQPPMPPIPPEDSMPSNSAFQYHLCRWLGGPRCGGLAPGRNREMGEHLRVYHRFIGHERDTVQCEWENCGQTMQRMNVPRHIVSRHLLAAASCRFCGKRFSRPDVVTRHERTCAGGLPVPNSYPARI